MIDSEIAARDYVLAGWGAAALRDCEFLVDRLQSENERQNLVSRNTLADVWVRHIADSAQLLAYAPPSTRNWVDIGSGAGFPGLMVAILRRDWSVTLIEPRRLRVEWLEQMKKELGLETVTVVQSKVERWAGRPYDLISARAVADLTSLLQMTGRLGGRGAKWVFVKGRNARDEITALPPPLRQAFVFHVEQSLTSSDASIIVATRAEEPS